MHVINNGKQLRNVQITLKDINDQEHYCLISNTPLYFDKDNLQGKLVSVFDVTKRVEAEKGLRRNVELLKEAQKIAHIGHWELDIVNDNLFWSDEIYRMFGLRPREFESTYEAFLDHVHPDDRQKVNKAYTDSLESKTPYQIEHRVILSDGTVKYVQEQCNTEYDTQGNPLRSIGVVFDITERKKAELELELSYKRLQRAEKIANIGYWIFDRTNNVYTGSEGAQEIYGTQNIKNDNKTVRKISLPEYRHIIDNAIQDLVNSGIPYDVEYRIKRPSDGKLIDIHSIGEYDPKTDTIFGIIQDITRQKKSERDLQESQAIIQAAMDHSLAGIAIADAPDGRLRYVNEAGLKIRGASKDTVVKNITAKKYPESWQIHHRDGRLYGVEEVPLARAVLFGERCKAEFMIKRTDGVFRYVLADAGPVLNREGGVVSAIVIFLDITESKEKERELEEYREKLEQMVKERTHELEEKVKEVEKLNKLFVGREFRINELKEELKKVKEELGQYMEK